MATNALSGIGSDQFLQLLVAQLQNQDPLDPVSDKDFINQLATLNTVQGLTDLNASFAQMLQLQQLTQGAELIGKSLRQGLAVMRGELPPMRARLGDR